jgi:CheY-like chemotaxis protein
MSAAIDILIVEDDPDDLELTIRTLRRHQLAKEVRVAHDGAEALDLLLGKGTTQAGDIVPKLVLLDAKLPKVSGPEVLRHLKSAPRTCAIPVVVFSSSDEERDISESYELGVNSYIVKPINFTQFTEVVRQIGEYWLVANQSPCRFPNL